MLKKNFNILFIIIVFVPNFLNAEPPLIGKDLYKNFILHLKSYGVPVSTGKFGAMMDVYLINQGPATFIIDSKT